MPYELRPPLCDGGRSLLCRLVLNESNPAKVSITVIDDEQRFIEASQQ